MLIASPAAAEERTTACSSAQDWPEVEGAGRVSADKRSRQQVPWTLLQPPRRRRTSNRPYSHRAPRVAAATACRSVRDSLAGRCASLGKPDPVVGRLARRAGFARGQRQRSGHRCMLLQRERSGTSRFRPDQDADASPRPAMRSCASAHVPCCSRGSCPPLLKWLASFKAMRGPSEVLSLRSNTPETKACDQLGVSVGHSTFR